MENKLCVKTPIGDLIVYPATDPEHPGVYIDLHRKGYPADMSVALIEGVNDEADLCGSHLITRVWGDAKSEDYTDRIIHKNVETFFGDTGWVVTDPDSFQIRRRLEDDVFELYQIDELPAGNEECSNYYRVSHAIVYLSDIDVPDVLQCYGYDSLEEFQERYREDWKGILAECDFELMCQNGEYFIGKPRASFEEAKHQIILASGYHG